MTSDKRFLLLGSIASNEAINNTPYANVPGSLWYKSFASGLQSSGSDVCLLSHVYDRTFPFGCLYPANKHLLDSTWETNFVKYINITGIRERSLTTAYKNQAEKLSIKGNFNYVVTYNPYPHHIAAAKIFQKNNIKWISILLDPPEKNFCGNWYRFNSQYGPADGYVFLSWKAFCDFPYVNKHHMDAGIVSDYSGDSENTFSTESTTLKILYSGKLEETYGGINHLIDFINTVSNTDIEFNICGKGYYSGLNHLAENDPRVILHGFVSDEKLHKLCLETDFFLNFRNPDHIDNLYIFPSKIAFYLQYAKPIFSIFTEGISPIYKNFIYFPDKNTGVGLALEFCEFLKTVHVEWPQKKENILRYIRNEGTWNQKAYVFKKFCDSI